MVYRGCLCRSQGTEIRKPWVFERSDLSNLWSRCCDRCTAFRSVRASTWIIIFTVDCAYNDTGVADRICAGQIISSQMVGLLGSSIYLNGYVCIPFSAAWGAACVFVVKIVHPLICKLVLLVPKWLTIGEDVAFGISIFVDISVTVAAILKFNKRLEKMEEIAAEFHRISDQIGSDIYKSVMEGMERQERIKEQTEARKEELRGMYLELQKRSPRMTTRMLRAFPKMQPRLHKEQFGRLKEFRRSEWLATKALKKARKAAKKNK